MNSNVQHLIIEHKPLILIVDDIPKNLQVLSSILSFEGYQISFASSGSQALNIIETSIPDLILLDVMMPNMDGYEVCRKLKSNPATADVPIIFLTGKVESEDIVHGLKIGAVDYITKPFNSAELLTRVQTHIELKLSRDAILKYNSELKEARQNLLELNATKDKFFSIIAHDLRGPFTGFLGLSQLLSEEYDSISKDELSKISMSMNEAAKRLFNFLENLLDWSRSQMGRMEFNPFQLNLSEVVDRVVSLFYTNSKEKNIKVENKIDADIYIFADHNMTHTVLRNLLSNALKFTRNDGFISISAQIDNDNFYEISITDNGVGMDEEAIQKIFRIDSKYSTPGTSNEQGTGLGLILCRELIEKNGGNISVESIINSGTTFRFTLPKYIY